RDAAPTVPDPARFDAGRSPAPAAPPATRRLAERAVVLASGRYVGGGIERADRCREQVFDLPVDLHAPGEATAFLHLRPQPAFAAGVRVDAALRPLDRDGRPRAANLFAAGSVIGGSDPAVDGTGAGLSWCTG